MSKNINEYKPYIKLESKSKIICKYFIHGKCIKGEKCPYLHSQFKTEQYDISEIECPMYLIGFCKNGPMCKFIHRKTTIELNKNNSENIKIADAEDDNINDTSSTPYDGESETISYHEEQKNKEEKSEIKEKDSDEEKTLINIREDESIETVNNKIIPIWYLEHYYDKPISAIFSDLENQNLSEVKALQEKYGFIQKDNQINMNLNFNNFDVKFAFNNYYSFNSPVYRHEFNPSPFYFNNNYNNYFYNYNNDPYMKQIDYIEYLINNFKTFYHLVRFKNYQLVNDCQINNQVEINDYYYKRYKYINSFRNNYIVIILIYNDESDEFVGFAKLEYLLKNNKYEEIGNSKNKKIFKINWLWKFGINYTEVRHLVNKADKNHFLCEGKNWCPIHPDLGHYMCRLMLNRLDQEEIFELINEKKIFQKQIILNQYKKSKHYKEEIESIDESESD